MGALLQFFHQPLCIHVPYDFYLLLLQALYVAIEFQSQACCARTFCEQ